MIALFLALQTTPDRPTLPTPPPCSAPFHDASIVQRVNPVVPQNAPLFQPVQGIAQVSIGPDGTVTAVQIVQSTGDPGLDAAILEAAKKSTYEAKTDDCTSMFGTYLFRASFSPASPLPSGAPPDPCNHEGRITTSAKPVYPLSLRLESPEMAVVRVTVGADGTLADAQIIKSTGNATLDQSAVQAAKQSAYAPKVQECKGIAAQYLMKFLFNPH